MWPNDPQRRQDVLEAAHRRRVPHLDLRRLDAYRLLNGPADGAPPGLTLDRYDRWLVLAARHHVPTPVVEAWAESAFTVLGAEGLVVKTLHDRAAKSTSAVLHGTAPERRIGLREEDATLLAALDDGLQTGLFLDHRETRLAARAFATGHEVLNLFAYTCAFSVHAALAGAARVTSVDVSRRALDWGRDNMRASGVSPDAHRWFTDDVVAHVRRGPAGQYGLIIADPPVMGRAKGRTFSLQNDLPALMDGTLRKLADHGVLVFSTHARALGERDLWSAARAAATRAGRRLQLLDQLGLPDWDHPVRPDDQEDDRDRGNYLKTLVLRVEGG